MSYILSAKTTRPLTQEDFTQQAEIGMCMGIGGISRLVLWGRITDCDIEDAVVGAIVKAFYVLEGQEYAICHTFSGCDGYYMMSLPQTVTVYDCNNVPMPNVNLVGSTIRIMATKSSCEDIFDDVCVCELS